MSNYKYLREIIEKIAEKGKIPKEDIADVMHYARGSSDRIRDVDNYINNPLLENVRNKQSLNDYISELEWDRGAEDYYDTSLGDYSNVSAAIHNKYNKYIPIRQRIKEREDILMDLLHTNRNNEEKAKLYEALLERLENHPLYSERRY